jgi:hypothetical protein
MAPFHSSHLLHIHRAARPCTNAPQFTLHLNSNVHCCLAVTLAGWKEQSAKILADQPKDKVKDKAVGEAVVATTSATTDAPSALQSPRDAPRQQQGGPSTGLLVGGGASSELVCTTA